VNGYYHIHLDAEGEPEAAVLEKIHTEQGFSIKYALQEYLKWKKISSN